jgi:hypothetical protein
MEDEREAAWGRLHEALPARWTVAQAGYDPGRQAWSVSAVGRSRGRGKVPAYVTGLGDNEVAALRDLDARLRGERSEGPRKLDEVRARLRLAYVSGAEEWARNELNRPLHAGELDRVIDRFPGR